MNNINIYAFADEASSNIDEQIVALKRNKLQGLEIRNVDGVNISDISYSKALEVKEKLDKENLFVWSIGSPIGKSDITDQNFDAQLDRFKRTLEIAKILNAKNIRIFSFFIPSNEDPNKYKEDVIKKLAIFIKLAKNYNINLCHENEKGIYGDTPERCLDLYKALPELKGIFDPANYVQCGVDTLKAWKLVSEYTHYIHIKDAKADGTVVPSGLGIGNVAKIAKDFILKGKKDFTIEPHLKVFEGLANLEKDGEKSIILQEEYPDSNKAFDAACYAFKNILKESD